MRIPGKRRLLLAAGSAATLGAVATLVSGVTFGLFSSSATPQVNNFAAGTVTLATDSSAPTPVTAACTYTNLAPGDAMTPCKLKVVYSGSLDAYVAVDVTITTTAGTITSAVPLYNPGAATPPGPGLAVTSFQDDETASYTVPSTALSAAACTAISPTATKCYQSLNELAQNTTVADATTWKNGDAGTFTFTPTTPFSINNGNPYQGSSATVTLAAHATQVANNGSISSPACTVGTTCSAAGNPTWS